MIWQVQPLHEPLSLNFDEDDMAVMAATRGSYIGFWRTSDGMELKLCPWHDSTEHSGTNQTPIMARYSTELKLLAAAYRGQPITLWDLEDNEFIGQLGLPHSVVGMTFSADPQMYLIVAAYRYGQLVLYDTERLEEKATFESVAYILASSPDGRSLVAGGSTGLIEIFDFESLKLMYRIESYDEEMRDLAFTSNNLRFLDIRRTHCNIWEPAVLVRKTDGGDGSSQADSEVIPTLAQTVSYKFWEEDMTITSIEPHHSGQYLFCGKEGGPVSVYDLESGSEIREIYRHVANTAVTFLNWNEKQQLLVSCDRSSRTLIHEIITQDKEPLMWLKGQPIEHNADHAIQQVLVSPDGQRILLAAPHWDTLLDTKGNYIHKFVPRPSAESRKWITHPHFPDRLLLLDGLVSHIYDWTTLTELSSNTGILLDVESSGSSGEILIRSLTTRYAKSALIAEINQFYDGYRTNHLLVWQASDIQPSTEKVLPVARYQTAISDSKLVIGVFGSLLVFLNYKGCICSVNLDRPPESTCHQHFFIPYEWQSGTRELIALVTIKGDVVFPRGDEIAVLKHGLEP